ncbi:hypothetical protein [Variovorax boronicumulans]|uniref:hypothetical protein n=1 Tax=Variovorax boronicumulans TaxID=436515 RepID=UPI000BB2EC38|nr:hypothetical protein [Variovorax boronicumulans]PBI86593.1 hypothetical protein BKP43_43630 [Variovorax boronicumulans]
MKKSIRIGRAPVDPQAPSQGGHDGSLSCPKPWDALEATATPGVRYCSDCGKNVFQVNTTEEVREAALMERCVAIADDSAHARAHDSATNTHDTRPMTPPNRIHFADNPWPEGHPVKEFRWTASVRNNEVWFDLHLRSEDYDAEREIDEPEDEDIDYPSDWDAPGVWTNYHRCTLSSTAWGDGGGFAVCALSDFSLAHIDGLEVSIDLPPPEDMEDNVFHIYLLGHDAAAHHRIRFDRIAGTDRFDITWTGKIALAYAGDYTYKYDFSARLHDVEAPRIPA